MATSLCCAALMTAVPSARGGGRLLLGRRAAPGSVFRGVGFTLSMAPPPKPKVVTMLLAWDKEEEPEPTNHGDDHDEDAPPPKKPEFAFDTLPAWVEMEPKPTDPPADPYFERARGKGPKPWYYGDEDEFDKYYAELTEHDESVMAGRHFTHLPLELSEEERAVQNKLKEIAERCMDLQADAMRRLSPEQRRPLYQLFRTVHRALASVKLTAKEGNADWGVSSLLIVHSLDVVRKMVSSACSAPLLLDGDKQELSLLPPLVDEAIGGGIPGVDSNPQLEVMFTLIGYTYNTVKYDIDKMITASGDATTTTS